MKALLIGLLLASPSVAAWMIRSSETAVPNHVQTAAEPPVQVPVEVVAKGCAPEWVYVQVPNQAVPEPGVVSLLALAGLLALRRQRK